MMLHENKPRPSNTPDAYDYSEPPPLERERWEAIRNGVIDELMKGNGKTLGSFASPVGIEVERLEIWLQSPDGFPAFGRRLSEKSAAVVIAEKLEDYLESLNLKTAVELSERVKTRPVAEVDRVA